MRAVDVEPLKTYFLMYITEEQGLPLAASKIARADDDRPAQRYAILRNKRGKIRQRRRVLLHARPAHV